MSKYSSTTEPLNPGFILQTYYTSVPRIDKQPMLLVSEIFNIMCGTAKLDNSINVGTVVDLDPPINFGYGAQLRYLRGPWKY